MIGGDAYDLSDVRLLVVDDNEYMRRLVATMARGLGIKKVCCSPDGVEVLKNRDLQRADIVVSDWLMEPMGGIDFVRAVRDRSSSTKPYIPVVMMCGFTETTHVIAARDAGTSEFLAIPVSPRALYERLLHVIHHPRPFVDAPGFFGPDRRRKTLPGYSGPERRTDEPFVIDDIAPDPPAPDDGRI